jgi:hypothetical protein
MQPHRAQRRIGIGCAHAAQNGWRAASWDAAWPGARFALYGGRAVDIVGEGIYLDLGVGERMGWRTDKINKLTKQIKKLQADKTRDADHGEGEEWLTRYTDPITEKRLEIAKLRRQQSQPVHKRAIGSMRRMVSKEFTPEHRYAPTVPMQANQLRQGHRTWDFAPAR